MKIKTFIIKFLNLIAIILFLVIILIIVIKKDIYSSWIKCQPQTQGRHSAYQN